MLGIWAEASLVGDGRRLGEDLTQGIYIYFMETQYVDGTTEVFSGDVMLVR